MAGNIDERIVEMTFRGTAFISGISQSIGALDKLKSSLSSFKGSTNDLNELDNAGRRFSLSGMVSSINDAAHHFSLLRIAGLTAFTTLTRQALFAGERLLAAFTIDPIKAGLDVYETKINAIQTILANTAAEGTNLKQVTAALNTLNTYANRTVYNFGQMAQNIGTFTAAGVHLDVAVSSIKGIANLAALSGAGAEQASRAMYQLSQAIAAGRVKLQDWNSVVNAGLGGKVFQNAILETARVNGVAVDAMLKKYGGFRNALQSGFVSSKILTQALSLFTGDLTDKQLKAMGFTAAETRAIQAQAKMAVNSATQIRTISQLMQALKEEVATAWSHVFEAIIGNSKQATATLSSFHNAAESFLTKPINSLAAFLESFNKLGGRQIILNTITTAFHSLGAVLHVVGEAFREVFPSNGGAAASGLIRLATAVEHFVQALTPSKAALAELKTIFVGLFSAVKIVIDIFGALFHAIFNIGGAAKGAGGGFLALLASIASFVTHIKNVLESSNVLTNVFSGLAKVIELPIHVIGLLLDKLFGLGKAANAGTSAISGFVQKVGQIFHGLGDAIASGIQSGSFQKVASLINTLLVGGILLKIKSFFASLGKSSGSGGLFATIKESFSSLTDTLSAMQARLKAGILEKIAIAIGILAAALLILSFIKTQNLIKALTAITALFFELSLAIKAIATTGGGIVKIAAVGVALDLLAGAVLILAAAVAILAQFSWDQLARGLGAITALLAALIAVSQTMAKEAPGLILTAIAMNFIAVAINLLALAVDKLGKENLGTLAKGIGSIAIILALLAGFNAISGTQLVADAAGMVLVGVALNIIARAIATLGALSPATIAKGLLGIAGALFILGVAMAAMPPTVLVSATGILVVSAAMVILSKALTTFGNLSLAQIGKSLLELAGALVILVGAMILATGGIVGAAAVLVMAGALAVLAPVLVVLGNLSWGSIAKGLIALVGVFVVLGAAGLVLGPLVPVLLGIAGAVALLGVGLLAAGAGVALFGVGLTALAVGITAIGAAIPGFVTNLTGAIPVIVKQVGELIKGFANVVGNAGPELAKAFAALATSMFDAIVKDAPKAEKAFDAIMKAIEGAIKKNTGPITTTFFNMLITILDRTTKFTPRLATAAGNLIIAMINGINKHINGIIGAATNLIVNFINAIGNGTVRVVNAGVAMVIRVINGIANSIRANSAQMNAAGRNLGAAIIQGMIAGIEGLAGGVFGAIENLASGAISAARNILRSFSPSRAFMDIGNDVAEGMRIGIEQHTPHVVDQVGVMGSAMLGGLAKTMNSISDTIDANLNLNPQITPVVDLTEAKKGLSTLNGLTKNQLISLSATSAQAASISTDHLNAASLIGLAGVQQTLNFTQNNTSPEALDEKTIYRKTKNQLSIARGALQRANSNTTA